MEGVMSVLMLAAAATGIFFSPNHVAKCCLEKLRKMKEGNPSLINLSGFWQVLSCL